MVVISTLTAFLVGLLVGGLAIYVGASIVTDASGFTHATVTAFVGAIVFAFASLLVGWIPLVGWLLPLLAWIWVINRRYPGGWRAATMVGVLAWIAALLVLSVLPWSTAIGVPGV